MYLTLTIYITRYTDFAKNKDVQMLGMLSMLMLQTRYCTLELLGPFPMLATSATPILTQQRPTSRPEFGGSVNTSAMLTVPKVGPVDYFNLTRVINGAAPMPPSSPEWPRLTTIPPMSPPPPLSNPSTSRGSWSLFGAGGVKQFVQETFTKDGPQTPSIVLDPSMVAENVKGGEGKAGRTLSGGSGAGGRALEGVGAVTTKQPQQLQQKKGKQRRESAYAVLQPQPQSQSAQMGLPLQQLQTGVDGPPPLPPPLPPPSTRSRSEIVPGPLKASLSFSSTSSGGSSGPGTGIKRSPLVPVENLDWGMRKRGGREADKGKKRVVFQEDEGDR